MLFLVDLYARNVRLDSSVSILLNFKNRTFLLLLLLQRSNAREGRFYVSVSD
jgi:hypothetical protein